MEEIDTGPFFVLAQGRQFVVLEGTEKCKPETPFLPCRVWYQRTATNGGAIYLFANKPAARVTSWYAEKAFGWIAEWSSHSIWLPKDEGWCNFWSRNSKEALELESMNPHQDRVWAENNYIEFTDVLVANTAHADVPRVMREMGRVTDHRRQNQHWKARAAVASAAFAAPYGAVDGSVSQPLQPSTKEIDMGSFDPYQAASEQQTRLASSSNKGKSVNNLKQACGTALSNVATNNKSAAIDAGYLTAGTIANNQFTKLAGKHLPVLVRGYADTPFGKLVLANVAQMLVQHFKADNKAAQRLTEAMMTSAMAEVIGSTGIEELIDGFLSDPKIAKALKTADTD